MQSGRIKNAAIKASSQHDKNHASYLGRLKRLRRGRLMGAWSARHNNYNQWLQVDLGKAMKVTGVATQGREEANQWVTAFYVLYSSDGVKFAKVKDWWDVVKVSDCKGVLLRSVPTFVTVHTFFASRDTRVSYGWCLLIQRYFCAVLNYAEKAELNKCSCYATRKLHFSELIKLQFERKRIFRYLFFIP